MESPLFIVVKRWPGGDFRAAETPHVHRDRGSAVLEARRLARQNEDMEFVVFEAIGKAVYQPVQVTMIGKPDLDEHIPF